jgi:hypothetical protein
VAAPVIFVVSRVCVSSRRRLGSFLEYNFDHNWPPSSGARKVRSVRHDGFPQGGSRAICSMNPKRSTSSVCDGKKNQKKDRLVVDSSGVFVFIATSLRGTKCFAPHGAATLRTEEMPQRGDPVMVSFSLQAASQEVADRVAVPAL